MIQIAEQILTWRLHSSKKYELWQKDSCYNPATQLLINKSFSIATTYNYIFSTSSTDYSHAYNQSGPIL